MRNVRKLVLVSWGSAYVPSIWCLASILLKGQHTMILAAFPSVLILMQTVCYDNTVVVVVVFIVVVNKILLMFLP